MAPPLTQPHSLDQPRWAREGIEIDSLNGSDAEMDEEGVMDISEEEALRKKKGRGRYPKPGCGLYVGMRKRLEEQARQKKKEAKKESARRALAPLVLPKGAKWNEVLRKEEDLEEELSNAPLEDVVARMTEQSTKIYKIADCSNGMKGSLVGEMRRVVAMVRAASTVLGARARENEETGSKRELERYRKEVEQLRTDIRELREAQKSVAPTPEFSPCKRERNKSKKRRRMAIVESSSGEEERDALPQMDDREAFPSLPSRSNPPREERRRRKEKRKMVSRPPQGELDPCIRGPTLKGVARCIEVYPPGLPVDMRREFDETLEGLSRLAINVDAEDEARRKGALRERSRMLQKISEFYGESSRAVRSSLAPAPTPRPRKGKSSGLTMESYVSTSVVEKEAKASSSWKDDGVGLPRNAPPPVTSAPGAEAQEKTGRKKKKKRKKGGGDTVPPQPAPPAPREKREPSAPQPSRRTAGNGQGPQKAPARRGETATTAKPAPPPPTKGSDEAWTTVVGRRARQGKAVEGRTKSAPTPAAKPGGAGKGVSQSQPPTRASPSSPAQGNGGVKARRRRTPRTAAVVITCPPGQYKEAIRLATEKIDLASLNINGITARKAVTGAQVFEVGGPDNWRKAEELAGKIREVLGERERVRVACPTPTAELRIRDLCEATEEEDVKNAVVSVGGCAPDLVKVGAIRFAGRGLGTAWVRCPLAVANKLAAAKKLRIGWTRRRGDPSSASGVWERGTRCPSARALQTGGATVTGAGNLGMWPGTAWLRQGVRYAQISAARTTTARAPAPVTRQEGRRADGQSSPSNLPPPPQR